MDVLDFYYIYFMIKQKKKLCKGCNKETYIFSKGFCKSCVPKTTIKKYSEKGLKKKEEKKEYTKNQTEFFLEIWKERKHNCQSCGIWLGNGAKSIFFDHLLEKNKRKDLALVKENILLVCSDCHSLKTMGFPTAKHLEYIKIAKEKYG